MLNRSGDVSFTLHTHTHAYTKLCLSGLQGFVWLWCSGAVMCAPISRPAGLSVVSHRGSFRLKKTIKIIKTKCYLIVPIPSSPWVQHPQISKLATPALSCQPVPRPNVVTPWPGSLPCSYQTAGISEIKNSTWEKGRKNARDFKRIAYLKQRN